MRVLITGATGHLGKQIANSLAAEAHELIYLVRKDVTDLPQGSVNIADFHDEEQLKEIFSKRRPEAIIHLAAMVGIECERKPEEAFAVNVEATEILASLAVESGARYFVFASTGSVYSQRELKAVTEDELTSPTTVYAKTKLEAEQKLHKLAEGFAMKFITFRIFNIYGPEFNNSLVYKLLQSNPKKPVELFGGDTFYRDYVFAGDVAQAMTNFESFGRLGGYTVLNMGSGVAKSNSQVVAELTEKGFEIFYEIKNGNPSYSWADISLAKQMLGFTPSTEFVA